jgi:hypothetical protein
MSDDPAVEAGRRVFMVGGLESWRAYAEAAAREALKPLRARHRKTEGWLRGTQVTVCAGCRRLWPCADARDIYPESELR